MSGRDTTRTAQSPPIVYTPFSYPLPSTVSAIPPNASVTDSPFGPAETPTRFNAFGYHSPTGNIAFPLILNTPVPASCRTRIRYLPPPASPPNVFRNDSFPGYHTFQCGDCPSSSAPSGAVSMVMKCRSHCHTPTTFDTLPAASASSSSNPPHGITRTYTAFHPSRNGISCVIHCPHAVPARAHLRFSDAMGNFTVVPHGHGRC